MKVLAHAWMGPPLNNAGSEVMLQTMLRDLVRRGHEATLLISRGVSCELDGVRVVSVQEERGRKERIKDEWHAWADVTITHLTATYDAIAHARQLRKPLVHLVHNDHQLADFHVSDVTCQLAVLNSEWLTERVGWPHRQIIVRPPVFAADYATTRGDRVTLVNLLDWKGADVFYPLAEALPGDRFLGVIGGYDEPAQIRRSLPNVEIVEHTDDMVPVYGRTRVVLMPSAYESWGRVAIEAAASGIPTIAHPTPGLLEALGPAGIFVDRSDLAGWVAALDRLADPDTYAEASALALARSAELEAQAKADLDLFEESLMELCS